ncbi:hypothetical protein [Microbulbifer sp. JMSA002]|uniref:hypothetical protein n=1 Tax=Microbulbifer sp. JMSA002 TaxID=3243368 RepID=UPI0040395D77
MNLLKLVSDWIWLARNAKKGLCNRLCSKAEQTGTKERILRQFSGIKIIKLLFKTEPIAYPAARIKIHLGKGRYLCTGGF